jgi:hypothetical protein
MFKKGKKVTWDKGNILKTNEATSPRPLSIKKGEGCAGDEQNVSNFSLFAQIVRL